WSRWHRSTTRTWCGCWGTVCTWMRARSSTSRSSSTSSCLVVTCNPACPPTSLMRLKK
ncbi:unnamed protein product, partial [Closterium sp. Naga37s-1]